MTMTEAAPTPATRGKNGGRRENGEGAALTDQVVLSGAGLASQGIGGLRRVADGSIAALDAIVLGGFGIADQIVRSNLVTDLATKSIAAARNAWTITVDTTRTALGDL